MKHLHKSNYFILALFEVFFFIFFPPLLTGGGARTARAATSASYSNVLEDLQKDKNFSQDNYPVVSDDYSLQVIQIAESSNAELFIYVYQPSGQTGNLTASSINLSVTINDDISFFNYKLELLNSSDTLYKYLIKDFTVKSDTTRYYCFSSIYRPYNEQIDREAEHDNHITEVNYPVNKQYCFSVINGNPYCSVIDIETITVTDKFVGFVRYPDGFKFFAGACDSHFVAFNTDKPIDRLLEADVYYTSQSFQHPSAGENIFGDKDDNYVPLKYSDKVEHTGGGWFAGTYKWDRIETVEQFISENDLSENIYCGAIINVTTANKITDEGKAALQGKKWVLRFTETSYSKSVLPGSYGTVYTENLTLVGDVTILRLKFETDGVVYNLGVIDNKQTGSKEPVNDFDIDINFANNDSGNILKIILTVIFTVILIVLVIWLVFKLIDIIRTKKE